MDNAFIATFGDWDHRTPKPWQRLATKILRRLRLSATLVPTQPPMANVEARMNIFHLLEQTLAFDVPGDVVELGCNAGESALVIQTILQTWQSPKAFHAYDSFQGLPPPTGSDAADGVYSEGFMKAEIDHLKALFAQAGQPLPHLHPGWFEDTVPAKLPDRISFALIDGDLYASTRHLLPHVYARMSPGAIGLFGIYYDEAIYPRPHSLPAYKSPGVKRATDAFFADKPERVHVLYANEYSNGYFRKR